MDCQQAHLHLDAWALEALAEPYRQALEAHLDLCPACRRAADDARGVLGLLKNQPSIQPSDALQQSLRTMVARQAAHRRGRRRAWKLLASGAAAAAVMLAVMTAARLGSNAPCDTAAAAQAAGPGPELWRHEIDAAAGATGEFVVRGASMYVLRKDGPARRVAALDAASGLQRWQSPLESLGHLAADDQRVFTLSSPRQGKLELAALDAADGRVLWRFAQNSPERLAEPCRPVVLDGGKVCWTNHDRVHLLDAASGQTLWSTPIAGQGLISTAAVDGGNVYVASGRSLWCLNASDGRLAWQVDWKGEASLLSRPLVAVAAGRAYAVQRRRGGSCQLLALDLDRHQVAWSRAVPFVFHMLADESAVFLRTREVLALGSRDGQLLWTQSAEGCGPMTASAGVLHYIVSGSHSRLAAVDQATGHEVWTLAGVPSCGPFIRHGQTGYFETHDGVIHALAFNTKKN
ncbi:MAG: PQQ-binding-like beta-propeller repeat protein [Planctomycetaceae bacterium]|nr:PQQ-binding-like beta-propeller repeat protein [Planctomycetaceae bacterium]